MSEETVKLTADADCTLYTLVAAQAAATETPSEETGE